LDEIVTKKIVSNVKIESTVVLPYPETSIRI